MSSTRRVRFIDYARRIFLEWKVLFWLWGGGAAASLHSIIYSI
jgi:hypothetical protein